MSSLNKYRVHEVAKDFGIGSKIIVDILKQYATAPKNHMQVLEDKELSLIFEYLTQHNQVSGIQEIFAEVYREPQAVPAVPEAEKKVETVQEKPEMPTRPVSVSNEEKTHPTANQTQQPTRPAVQSQPAPTVAKPISKVPEKKLVDTRKTQAVNLERYDERLENLAPERANKMKQGREKFKNSGNQRRGGPSFSNKRKQEEQEKLRRLQLEVIKNTPCLSQVQGKAGEQ